MIGKTNVASAGGGGIEWLKAKYERSESGWGGRTNYIFSADIPSNNGVVVILFNGTSISAYASTSIYGNVATTSVLSNLSVTDTEVTVGKVEFTLYSEIDDIDQNSNILYCFVGNI